MPLRTTCFAGAGLGLLALLGACHAPAPPASPLTRRLPARQVLADLQLLQRIKEAADAGLYKYHAKRQLDSAFAALRARVTGPFTVLQAYRLVAELTDYEGSLHNDTTLPDSVQQALHAEATYFPYPLKLVAGQLLVNATGAPLPVGAVVHSIDGHPARQLVRELGAYYTTDGLNQTGKQMGLAESLPEYYRWYYGPQTAFAVRYSLPTAPADTLQRTLPAVSYAATERAFARRHSRLFDHDYFEEPARRYRFQMLPRQRAAVLTLPTFELGEDGTAGHRQYARFLDSCFQMLRRTPAITSLVVDVQANGGGDDNNDMLAFSYLAQRPFREHRAARAAFGRVPYRRYLTVAHDTAERAALVADAARTLAREFTAGSGGQWHGTARSNPVFQPQALRFRGQGYLLVSSRVASAGSMFAAMVRGNTTAVVVGEETMGGYYGHTGHQSLTYTLPHTGIQVSFAWVDLDQDVPTRPTQPPGRGILPDTTITQSPADFLANRNAALLAVLRLIGARQQPRAGGSF